MARSNSTLKLITIGPRNGSGGISAADVSHAANGSSGSERPPLQGEAGRSGIGASSPLTLASTNVGLPSVDAPFQARENVGVVAARGRMLSSVRPWMRREDSRRPVWEFAARVQITRSVLEAQWKALVVPAPSRRLLRHTLLPLALTSSRSWSAYAAAAGVL